MLRDRVNGHFATYVRPDTAVHADEVVVSDDRATARVTFRQTWRLRAGGEEGRQAGTWLMVWRRDPIGEWRLAQEMRSPHPAG